MQRSAGVTASAVIALIGSGLTLLWAFLLIFGLFAMAAQESQPKFVQYFMVALVIIMFAMSGWGIASGVGILRRQEWARISIMIFSGIMLIFTLPGLLMIPFIPMQPPAQGNLPSALFTGIKIGIGMFYALLSALGAWWLYFFNKKGTREEFKQPAADSTGETGSTKRPLSIAVIGWYLVVTSPLFLFMIIFRFPIFFFGYVVVGNLGVMVLTTMACVQILGGIGLLRLRPWGRTLSICYFVFGILQVIVSAVLPGSDARFQAAVATIMARLNTPQTPFHFSPWFPLLSVLPLYGVLFLITRKRCFENAPAEPVPVA
jgi:hypothetical protein